MKGDHKLTSANKYYKEKIHISSYDNKYFYGKSIYDDLFDENFVSNQVKELNKGSRILEIGSYTGRISKKLEKHMIFFDQSDIHKQPIYKGPNTLNYFPFELDKDLPKEIPKNKYDFIISLGHQVSFTNNIEIAISNMSKLLKKNGILMFDVWQTSSRNKLPEYKIETATKTKVIEILKQNKLKVKKVFNGQTLIYSLNMFFQSIISKYSKFNYFNKFYFLFDRYLFSKIPFLNLKSQSIIFVVIKIDDI
jgi:SAM-dependent methyltransferase